MSDQPQLALDKPQAMSPQEFLDLCARESRDEVRILSVGWGPGNADYRVHWIATKKPIDNSVQVP